jgi:hypothetical protein
MVKPVFPEGYMQPPRRIFKVRYSMMFEAIVEHGSDVPRFDYRIVGMEPEIDVSNFYSSYEEEAEKRAGLEYVAEMFPSKARNLFHRMLNLDILLFMGNPSPDQLAKLREKLRRFRVAEEKRDTNKIRPGKPGRIAESARSDFTQRQKQEDEKFFGECIAAYMRLTSERRIATHQINPKQFASECFPGRQGKGSYYKLRRELRHRKIAFEDLMKMLSKVRRDNKNLQRNKGLK